MPEKKKINPETVLIIAIIVLAITFVGLVTALVVKNSSKAPASTETATAKKDEKPSNEEDDPDADDSVTTRQFNSTIKKDMSQFLVYINQYQSNNRGAIPTDDDSWNNFNKNYLEAEFANKYSFVHCDFEKGNCILPSTLTWAANANTIYTATHANCNGENLEYVTGKRKLAVYIHLKGETNGVYCVNN